MLGHLRHEIGHYYWDRLIRNSNSLGAFRELFGDDTLDYDQAVQRHYEQGAPAELGGVVHQRLRHHASLGRLGGNLGALPAHGRHARDRQEPRPFVARARRRAFRRADLHRCAGVSRFRIADRRAGTR